VIDVLVDAGFLDRSPERPSWPRHLEARIHLAGRTLVKRMNWHRSEHRNNLDFHHHRFPGVTTEELERKIEYFARLLGRFQGLRVARISEHIFTISK